MLSKESKRELEAIREQARKDWPALRDKILLWPRRGRPAREAVDEDES